MNKRDFSRQLRTEMTQQERKLWYMYLKNHRLNWKRQRIKGNYILDFYCPIIKLAIELDGEQHYSKSGISYDNHRTELLKDFNITVIRFSNYDINCHFNEVCESIEHIISQINPQL